MKKLLLVTGILFFLLSFFKVSAQTLETFTPHEATPYATSFISNGQTFTINTIAGGHFYIYDESGANGWNGTAADSGYVDNTHYAAANTPVDFSLSTTKPFRVNKFWLFVASYNTSDGSYTLAHSGAVTIKGTLNGVTQFSETTTSGYNPGLGDSNTTEEGFTLFDMSTFGGADNTGKNIDALEIITDNTINYVALDALTWTSTTVLTSLTKNNPSPSNSSSVQYTATFDGPITGLSASNFNLATTGSIAGASITSVTGSGSTYTITVNTGTGTGTVQLNFVNDTGISLPIGTIPYSGEIYSIDHDAPTVSSINRADTSPTNATSANYTVTFSEAVAGVDVSDFNLVGLGVTGNIASVTGSGTTYTVTVNNINGNGALRLDLNSSGTGIVDAVSNPIATGFTSGQVYTIDQTPPTISSINRADASPTNAATVHYTVTFSEGVAGVDISDFSLTGAGVTGTIASVTGSGTTYTVTVNSVAGNGTLRLDLNSSGTGITDASTNAITTGFTTGQAYTIDQTPPTVVSINPVAASPSNGTSAQYTVTFSEAVTGVDITDFALAGTGVTGTIASVTGSGTTYTVTVNSISGNGGLGLNLNGSATGIADIATNPINGGFTGQVLTIDQTAPTVASINRVDASPTNAATVHYTVTFNEAVTGVDITDFGLTDPGITANIASISGSGTTYTVTINNITGNGILVLTLNSSGTGIADLAGNSISGGFLSGQAYSIDQTAPTITISAPSVANTVAGPVTYTITYADANFNTSTLTAANVTLNTTGNAAGTIGVTGSGTTYTVTISGITGSGNMGISIAAGTATDKAGNAAAAAGPSATFTVLSGNNSLAGLTVSGGTLTPVFDTNTTTYTVLVPNAAASVLVTPTTADANATVTVNGTAVTSGNAATIPLVVGTNTITVVVTAANGTTKTYTITATRDKATPTTTFAAIPAKTYGNADFDPGATSDNPGVAITYTSDNPAVATIVAGKVHIVGAGTANITASQAGDATHYAAPDKTQPLTVNKAAITVTADAKTKVYGTADPAFTYQITSGALVGTDAFTGALSRVAGENVGTYAINQNTLALNTNYTLTYVSANLTITKAALTITANNQSKVFRAPNPTLTVSYSGFVNGDTQASLTTQPTVTTTAITSSPNGTYPITASGAVAANYTITYVAGTLTISGAVLNITVNNQSKTYGSANPALTLTYTGFVPGDDASSLATQPTVTTTATAASGVGTYPITASGAASPNYTITYTQGTLTVNKATLTVTADNKSRNYNENNPPLTYTYSGFVNGDTPASLTTQPTASTTATITNLPGNFPITLSGGVAANYTFNYVPGTLTIVAFTNAYLSGLAPSSGTLSPVFLPTTFNYTLTAGYNVNYLPFTLNFDPTASATINGANVPNGSPSYGVPLVNGNNTITILVTAQDGVTKLTYTITVYKITPPAQILPTNILTPNGDGKNDTWIVKDIQLYPNNTVRVFDSGGRLVFSKKGYTNDWGGTLNGTGSQLAVGTYYYIVDLGVGGNVLKGYISIISSK
jgi:gliding motility-associated-like protein